MHCGLVPWSGSAFCICIGMDGSGAGKRHDSPLLDDILPLVAFYVSSTLSAVKKWCS